MNYSTKTYVIPFYLFFYTVLLFFRRSATTDISYMVPIAITLNNMTYHYVAQHTRAVKPLKSRYGDDMVISEEDAARAVSYDGYTVQGYMYLNYYGDLFDLFCIGCGMISGGALLLPNPHSV